MDFFVLYSNQQKLFYLLFIILYLIIGTNISNQCIILFMSVYINLHIIHINNIILFYIHRVIHQACSPPFCSIMQLLKIWFLKFLNNGKVLKEHIFKYLGFFILLKECPVEIQISVFKRESHFLIVNYSMGNFSEIFDLLELKFIRVVFELLDLCVLTSKDKKSMVMSL